MKKFLLAILVVLGIFSHQGCAADTQTTNNTDIQVSLTEKKVQSMEQCLENSILSDALKEAKKGVIIGTSFGASFVLLAYFLTPDAPIRIIQASCLTLGLSLGIVFLKNSWQNTGRIIANKS